MNNTDHPPHFFRTMSTFLFSKVSTFFATHKTYTASLFVVIVAIVGYAAFSSPTLGEETFAVSLGEIQQFVKVSGQVEASRDANLAFQSSGQVAFLGVTSGQMVTQGQVLATLDGGDSQAQLLSAEASYASGEAKLGQLQQGARKEELAVKEQAVENAKNTLEQTYYTLPDAIQNVDAVTADIVKNKFSALFNANTSRYSMTFSSCNQTLQGDIESKRAALENTLALFQTKSTTVSALSSQETIDATFLLAYNASLATNDLVGSISNLLLLPCSTTNSSLDGFRSTLSSVKTSMTSLFSDITAKRSALYIAKNTFNQATRDLELAKAGTDPYVLKAQVASLAQAEAAVAQARAGVQKTIIRAPFTGVVSNVDISLGETAATGKTVISMLASNGYEIEAKIPEIDIVKIKLGAKAEVTLDAYGKTVVFPATVTRINPTASTEGSVPVYKIIVTFMGQDDRIRQGMTANVEITTESKAHVLAVPARFIKIVKGSEGSVIVRKKNENKVVDITLGIRGKDGLIEVTNGLLSGDVLVSPEIGVREAQKQTK